MNLLFASESSRPIARAKSCGSLSMSLRGRLPPMGWHGAWFLLSNGWVSALPMRLNSRHARTTDQAQ
jgi:hypothetical protein